MSPKLLFAPINRVVLAGYCTHDPEVKYTDAGLACCDFQIAGREPPVRGPRPQSVFIQVGCVGPTAEFTARLRKGLPIVVEGHLRGGMYRGRPRVKLMAHSIWRLTEDTPDDDNGRSNQSAEEGSGDGAKDGGPASCPEASDGPGARPD